MKYIMKRAIVLCFTGVFLAGALYAEDFSQKSLSELLEIQSKLMQAIWNSKEFKEAVVPAGTYEIGTDIPAGKWKIEVIAKHGDFLNTISLYKTYTNGKYEDNIYERDFWPDGVEIINLTKGTYLRLPTECKFTTFVPLF